jgi:hypothetical protein
MRQETRVQNSETVRAIWNQARTLKICLGEYLIQEETQCECLNDHSDDDNDDEPLACDESAWPRSDLYNGPIVVSGDGCAHFCEDCVRDIDPDFVDAHEDAFSQVTQGERPYLDEWMDAMAAAFPPGCGIIEPYSHRSHRDS